jgi:hypothetical protein
MGIDRINEIESVSAKINSVRKIKLNIQGVEILSFLKPELWEGNFFQLF